MDNINDADVVGRMARIGLIRKVWIVCEDRWIHYSLIESAWRTEDDPAQYLFRCPMCDQEHISALIWERADI